MDAVIQIYIGTNGLYYFRLKSRGNRENILSSEGYTTKAGCLNGIESVKTNSQFYSRYVKRTAGNGQFYFVLIAANSTIIGTSEMYLNPQSRENGIDAVKRDAAKARVEDMTTQKIYLY